MDEKTLSIAQTAVKMIPPLKGYNMGVLDAKIYDDGTLNVVVLDGRKFSFNINDIKPAPKIKSKPKKGK